MPRITDPLDTAKLDGSYGLRSEYLLSLWKSAETPFAKDGIRRTVDRDLETSKSAVTLSISLAAIVGGLTTIALKAAPEWNVQLAIPSILLIVLLLTFTFLAQRRVIISSDLLTKMDLAKSNKMLPKSAPMKWYEPLRRLFQA